MAKVHSLNPNDQIFRKEDIFRAKNILARIFIEMCIANEITKGQFDERVVAFLIEFKGHDSKSAKSRLGNYSTPAIINKKISLDKFVELSTAVIRFNPNEITVKGFDVITGKPVTYTGKGVSF